ncbi:hypothetical protein FRC11_004963 [Ceratobasidium sp. 423]|nr:hypothetical protein FRC11_004963 [Ceratobasidium sp. 423]
MSQADVDPKPGTREAYEEEIRLLKLLRSRAQIPIIPESEGFHVPRLQDVQGDVLLRFPKASPPCASLISCERFIFFYIDNTRNFKKGLANFKPTSALDVKNDLLRICREKDKVIKEAIEEERDRLKREARSAPREQLRKLMDAFNKELEGTAFESTKEEINKILEASNEDLEPAIQEAVKKAERVPIDWTGLTNIKPHKRLKLDQRLIAFSRRGMNLLGIDDTGDDRFDKRRMNDDRVFLGDQSDWQAPFDAPGANNPPKADPPKGTAGHQTSEASAIHGVIVLAGETGSRDGKGTDFSDLIDPEGREWEARKALLEEATKDVEKIFGDSIKIQKILDGQVRAGEFKGHEHFGFLDGISQPAIRDLEFPLPGQTQVDAGVVVMGYPGDPVPKWKRPDWCRDGSMMVFRKLQQSVLSFEKYCKDNGDRDDFIPGGKDAVKPRLNPDERAELFAARMLGRWKSGTPLALAPYRDDPTIGSNPKRNNDFDYTVIGVPHISAHAPSDFYCPFTAHARKTGPRNLDPYVSRQHLASSSIVRAGIPYGPEVDDEEREKWNNKQNPIAFDSEDRGLLFVCYASHLDSGFVRQTTKFGNNDFFPTTDFTPTFHGQDPIIGGPPAKGSSNEVREIGSIGDKPKRFEGMGRTRVQASVDEEVPFKVSDGEQVHFEFKVGDENFEVSGLAKVQPEHPNDSTKPKLPTGADNPFFVTSRGGEYFFVPSIPTLKSWAT